MNPINERSNAFTKKIIIVIVALVLTAGLVGWYIGRSGEPEKNNQATSSQQDTSTTTSNSDSDVKSFINYSLPDGWKEISCASAPGAIYTAPSKGATVDCDNNPSAPVKISVDSANNKDCNQLQNVQNVSKHVCISEYINGRKSLRAETVYNNDSSYKKATTVDAYYIDTGTNVIKIEYVHDPNDSQYKANFEQLAKSVQVKGQ